MLYTTYHLQTSFPVRELGHSQTVPPMALALETRCTYQLSVRDEGKKNESNMAHLEHFRIILLRPAWPRMQEQVLRFRRALELIPTHGGQQSITTIPSN